MIIIIIITTTTTTSTTTNNCLSPCTVVAIIIPKQQLDEAKIEVKNYSFIEDQGVHIKFS